MAGKAAGGGWNAPNMAWGNREAQGKKNRHAYNSHVQRERLNKFYDRKKTLTKYKRTCRFEDRSQPDASGGAQGSSLLEQAMHRDAADLEDEYERRLSLSYGSADSSSKPVRDLRGKRVDESGAPKKKKKRKRAGDFETAEEPVTADAAPEQRAKRRKKVAGEESAGDAAVPAVAEVAAKQKVAGQKQQKGAADKHSQGSWQQGQPATGGRFSKDLKEFQEKREAAEKERERRREEEAARKRQQKKTAQNRAVKGQLINQRTARGQPKMNSILEDLAAKLAGERQQKQKAGHERSRAEAPSGASRSRHKPMTGAGWSR